ncbi:MAG: radical SAM protein, partial [Candidatus Aenigmarchaeota archaeon]|nr:radical SAM protein [Candidatus Aenigmarchaeota archaeon]
MYNSNETFDLDTCYECNNNCLMCTTIRPGYLKKDIGWTKKTSEFKKTIDACDPQLRTFCFTGGEPTIRPGIIELVQYVLQKLPITTVKLITNGRMLAYPDFVDKLISTGLKNYILPVHAHASELHDFITQADGSFEQTKKGILNLLEYDT